VISYSSDNGRTWTDHKMIWPQYTVDFSIFCSVSSLEDGRMLLFGTMSPIKSKDEPYFRKENQGVADNELIWAISDDYGYTWSEPKVIPMPFPCSAEAPGRICITKDGSWLAPFSPCNTFDPDLLVPRNQVVVMISRDEGKSWKHGSMIRFDEPGSGAAEAWLTELSDGRLLGTCWHIDYFGKKDHPNAYAVSYDVGETWTPTGSTGIMGQSTALAPLRSGKALFIYNQRKYGEVGVWMALVDPSGSDFGIEANEVIWKAQTATQKGEEVDFIDYEDFAFGEPSVIELPDGDLIVSLWCTQPSESGIKFLKLKLTDS